MISDRLLSVSGDGVLANRFVESSFWNFDALFQPQAHPGAWQTARSVDVRRDDVIHERSRIADILMINILVMTAVSSCAVVRV